MSLNFSQELINILSFSREEAARLGCYYIGLEHLFLGILREPNQRVKQIITPILPSYKEIKKKIEALVDCDTNIDVNDLKDPPLNIEAENAIKLAFLEFLKYKSTLIEPEHLLLGILFEKESEISKLLMQYNLSYSKAEKIAQICFNTPENFNVPGAAIMNYEEGDLDDYEDDFEEIDDLEDLEESFDNVLNTQDKGMNNNIDNVLSGFGTDITKEAAAGHLDPIIGREKELERMAQILSRRKKNNLIILGESGVGKTAMIEGLAMRIVEKKVPRNLYNKKIFSIDIASVVAGTKYRGDFEKRIKNIIEELKHNKNIILFIDEIHTIIGAGNAAGSIDASSILKPALTKGEIQCVGTTTYDEYRQFIEKDVAFERRFQKVNIDPTTCDETITILNHIKEKYEQHHFVRYSDDAIKSCVILSNRYITDRFLPDKAIDALDEAGARVHIKHAKIPKDIISAETKLLELASKKRDAIKLEKFEEAIKIKGEEERLSNEINKIWDEYNDQIKNNPTVVSDDDVAEVISMSTGIPVNKISYNETEKLINLEEHLRSKVIGQDKAIHKISKAIRRNRAGLKNPDKPIGSFIFLGQTGVGKTHLAKTIAEMMFDSQDALIRIDMGEYTEKFSVSRLIGAPPGYVGYEEGGQLTEKIRRKPYCVVLLDEIEKAHHDIYNVMLQMLDYGFMTDGLGRKIDFRNTIIIMTSNIGSRQAKDFGGGIGFNALTQETIEAKSKAIIEKELKKTFSPEFINRIDEIITFNSLTKDDLKEIMKIEINLLAERMKEIDMSLKVEESVLNYILENEWDLQYGARPLHRAITNFIEDPIAEKLISDNTDRKPADIIVGIDENNNIEVDVNIK